MVFPPQVAGGKPAEFSVDQGREFVQGPVISLRPIGQEPGYIVRRGYALVADKADLVLVAASYTVAPACAPGFRRLLKNVLSTLIGLCLVFRMSR